MKRVKVAILLIVMSGAARAAAEPLPLPPDTVFYMPLVQFDGNPKHGLAWSFGGFDQNAADDYQITWYFHWAAKAYYFAPSYVEFVPMLWCDDTSMKDALLRSISTDYGGYLLIANEPEFPDQCDATAERVAELVHWTREQYPNAKLVAPQTHVCWWEDNPPTPPCGHYGPRFTVESFIRAYRAKYHADPPLVAYGVHYGDPAYWSDRLARFLDDQGLSEATLWYTEFNYCGSDLKRFEATLNYLEQHPRVERYAYWSNLVAGDHCSLAYFDTRQLTPLGVTYRKAGQ